MRNIHLVIGIVVILALVCSPALAIRKSDLIAQYQGPSLLHETLEFDDDTPICCGNLSIFERSRPYVPNSTPTPAPTMVSQADLIASYETPPRPSLGVTDFFTLFKVISAENPYHEGLIVYADREARLYFNPDPVTVRWDPRACINCK